MNKKIKIVLTIIILIIFAGLYYFNFNSGPKSITIGFISDLTGPVAKYGAYESGKLAMDDINKNGGINRRPLKIIFEDGKCNGKDAVNAAQKLIDIDKVDVILGGHCSPESAAIAPVAEKNKIIMLASISTTPVLTRAGKYVFRTSPVSVAQSQIIAEYAYQNKFRKFGIIFEQTAYATPIAEALKSSFEKLGGSVPLYEGVAPNTTDYRTILAKVKSSGVDALFFAPQSPDSGFYMMQQAKDLGIKAKLFGNDVAGNQKNIDRDKNMYEGFILALPDFDKSNPKIKAFIDEYTSTYKVSDLPYGIWTAETYDAVNIIADGLKQNGDNVEKLRTYLENIDGYEGVSGTITINKDHDGVRVYSLKIVKDGQILNYK